MHQTLLFLGLHLPHHQFAATVGQLARHRQDRSRVHEDEIHRRSADREFACGLTSPGSVKITRSPRRVGEGDEPKATATDRNGGRRRPSGRRYTSRPSPRFTATIAVRPSPIGSRSSTNSTELSAMIGYLPRVVKVDLEAVHQSTLGITHHQQLVGHHQVAIRERPEMRHGHALEAFTRGLGRRGRSRLSSRSPDRGQTAFPRAPETTTPTGPAGNRPALRRWRIDERHRLARRHGDESGEQHSSLAWAIVTGKKAANTIEATRSARTMSLLYATAAVSANLSPWTT